MGALAELLIKYGPCGAGWVLFVGAMLYRYYEYSSGGLVPRSRLDDEIEEKRWYRERLMDALRLTSDVASRKTKSP